MNGLAPIRFEPYDVDARLEELGLTREPFVIAAQQGWTAYASCTRNHPPTFPGTVAWAETIRSLRDSLTAPGWTRQNEANLPLILNAAKTLALTVSSGDENTGRRDAFPKTRSSKGPRTQAAIRLNQIQQTFEFMEEVAPVVASVRTPGRSTWLFLVYRDIQSNELRYELSHPISMGEDGNVDDWAERILFPPDPIDPASGVLFDDGLSGQSPDITVEIRRIG